VPLPREADVKSIETFAPNDVWVGGINWGAGPPLLLHWDGVSWKRLVVPRAPGGYPTPAAVVGRSGPDDLWIATSSELIRRDATGLHSTPLPNHLPFLSLHDFAFLGPRDAWAAGDYVPQSGPYQHGPVALILHWDGATWSRVEQPMDRIGGTLEGIAAAAPDDIWVVGNGDRSPFGGSGYGTITEHWDGASWSVVPSPGDGFDTSLHDIDVISSGDAWAVGTVSHDDYGRPLFVHWDGQAWSSVQPDGAWRTGHAYEMSLSGPGLHGWVLGDRHVVRERPYGSESFSVTTLDHIRADGSWAATEGMRGVSFLDIDTPAPGIVWAAGGRTLLDDTRIVAVRCRPGSDPGT
jgi:hypothetical protein